MTKLEVRVENNLKLQVARAASARNMTLSQVVRCLLSYWLISGAPDVTLPEPGMLPGTEEADQLAKTLAIAAFRARRIAFQIGNSFPYTLSESTAQLSSLEGQSPISDSSVPIYPGMDEAAEHSPETGKLKNGLSDIDPNRPVPGGMAR